MKMLHPLAKNSAYKLQTICLTYTEILDMRIEFGKNFYREIHRSVNLQLTVLKYN